ncbi:MAG: CopG family transcriptional regulator [Steroidobacteraceae bacterium]
MKAAYIAQVKSSIVKVRLDPALAGELAHAAERSRCSRNELARELLRRHLGLAQLNDLRRMTMPFSAACGYLTDEDVFRDLS